MAGGGLRDDDVRLRVRCIAEEDSGCGQGGHKRSVCTLQHRLFFFREAGCDRHSVLRPP
jgi:hypothetical protein